MLIRKARLFLASQEIDDGSLTHSIIEPCLLARRHEIIEPDRPTHVTSFATGCSISRRHIHEMAKILPSVLTTINRLTSAATNERLDKHRRKYGFNYSVIIITITENNDYRSKLLQYNTLHSPSNTVVATRHTIATHIPLRSADRIFTAIFILGLQEISFHTITATLP
jgi:hypothetical protein